MFALAIPAAQAAPVTLGQAFSFGVLAGTTVTNTGPSVVYGNVGVSTGSAITGFSPDMIIGGTQHSNNATAQQAQTDLGTAYNVIKGEAPTENLTDVNLGGINSAGLTLGTGVYKFDGSAQLTGPLTLDGGGDPNARFDFQIFSTLITDSGATVTLINGASAANIFWQVGSSATLGTGTVFQGNILAQDSITLTTGATVVGGRALARTGAVTLDTNQVGFASAVVPEPGTLALALPALAMAGAVVIQRRKR